MKRETFNSDSFDRCTLRSKALAVAWLTFGAWALLGFVAWGVTLLFR